MTGQPRRILLIDDEAVVLDSCLAILDGGEHDVATASSGEEGLEQVRAWAPDLVFVDLKMPGMPGMQVLEEVRSLDPTIVCVVFTGFATIGSAVEAMQHGAYDFLPKPSAPDEFRPMIRRALQQRTLLVERAALRREREALRENFAAIVSHELRSPHAAVQQNLFATIRELDGVVSEVQQRDQRWCKIYAVSADGYVGLVDETRGMHKAHLVKPVQICMRVPDVDAWHAYLKGLGVEGLTEPRSSRELKLRAFVCYDPEGYQIEIQSAL